MKKPVMKLGAILVGALLLSACGGGSSNNNPTPNNEPKTLTGQFKDRNVAGLDYKSESFSGKTDSEGRFKYKEGETVAFSVGAIELGKSDGKSVVTAIDLVEGGTFESTKVVNINHLLQTLDSDGNPDNEITIKEEVAEAAKEWKGKIDLDAEDMSLDTILESAQLADASHTYEIPEKEAVKAHFEKTLRCAYTGAYRGNYTGSTKGVFGMLVWPDTSAKLKVYNKDKDLVIGEYIYPVPASELKENIAIKSGENIPPSEPVSKLLSLRGDDAYGITSSLSFDGVLTPQKIVGSWKDGNDSGSFSGEKIESLPTPTYRYVGSYYGDDEGLITFDVADSDEAVAAIKGEVVSMFTGERFTGTGTLNLTSGELSVTMSNGTKVTATMSSDSILDLNGSWSNSSSGDSGAAYMGGCKLN